MGRFYCTNIDRCNTMPAPSSLLHTALACSCFGKQLIQIFLSSGNFILKNLHEVSNWSEVGLDYPLSHLVTSPCLLFLGGKLCEDILWLKTYT